VLPSIVIPSFLLGKVAKTPALESVVPAMTLRFFGKPSSFAFLVHTFHII